MNIIIRISIFALVILTLCNCSSLTNEQIVKARAFGTATSDIGNLGEKEFVNIRDGIIEMNKELVIIDNTKAANSLDFEKPTTAEATAERVAASKALKNYGELLVELVSDNQTQNLKTTANELINNTSSALGKELPNNTQDAVSNLIVGLGSFWVEHKKAESLKKIVVAYQNPVDKLADLMSKDFSIAPDSLGFLKAYLTTAKRLKNASIRLLNSGKKYSVLEREKAVQALVMSNIAIIRAKVIAENAGAAISSLKIANNELVKTIKEKKYSTNDIKSYAKQIQSFVNIYQVLTK